MPPSRRERLEINRKKWVEKMNEARLRKKNGGIDGQMIWKEISGGMKLILARANERETIPSKQYMELYSHVFNYCTYASNHANASLQNNEYSLGIQGRQLYDALTRYLQCHLKKIVRERPEMTREQMLIFYVQHFEDFKFSSNVLNGMFSYLNKHWIPSRRQNEAVLEIYPLAMRCWKCSMFNLMRQEITRAILSIIEQERNGDRICRNLIETVVRSYIELGPVDRTALPIMIGDQNLSTYVHNFETLFLAETREFYKLESTTFLVNANETSTVTEYMKKVEQRISEEEDRIRILHRSTLPKVIDICEQTLIKPHLETMYAQFGVLLRDEKKEDLRRLYNLVNRLDQESVTAMANHFETYVREFGENAVREIDAKNQNDPRQYFKKVSGVFLQYNSLIHTVFQSDMIFRASLDRACTVFINQNAVTGTSMQKSAMLLAKYSDLILRKSSGNNSILEEDVEILLNNLISIIRFLNDRDVFQHYYAMFFSLRLINETSNSDDLEEVFIGKLRTSLGNDLAMTKLQRMFLDIETSKQKTEQFNETLAGQSVPFHFGIKVLASGTWPFNANTEGPLVLPKELDDVKAEFEKYYFGGDGTGKNRKLSWLHGRSYGELKFYPPGSTSKIGFTLVASTYQITVLLLFQEKDEFSLAEIAQRTGLELAILVQVVGSLLKHKLLIRKLKTDENVNDPIDEKTILILSKNFKNARVKLNINTSLKSETKKDDERVDKNVMREREFMIQATIVRIMKTRKTLGHANLVAEVMEQVHTRFTPDNRQIRVIIEQMMEKEYIRRTAADAKVYEYIA